MILPKITKDETKDILNTLAGIAKRTEAEALYKDIVEIACDRGISIASYEESRTK